MKTAPKEFRVWVRVKFICFKNYSVVFRAFTITREVTNASTCWASTIMSMAARRSRLLTLKYVSEFKLELMLCLVPRWTGYWNYWIGDLHKSWITSYLPLSIPCPWSTGYQKWLEWKMFCKVLNAIFKSIVLVFSCRSTLLSFLEFEQAKTEAKVQNLFIIFFQSF